MEVVGLIKEGLQSVAEHAASYRLGQTALRHLDRALWVVEKCARWAVPPPLDQDDHPQPELVRPLPWVFFLMMLVTLRIARESISLINLVMGKPPLRSADVVMYIQSKRRYLRTLKYQGNRMMRARTSNGHQPWYSSLQSMFELSMCFRRPSHAYGNNNTTSISNNDEVLVVKRSKRGRQNASPGASTSESTMERLIEKMMIDLDADSDADSSYTLTNATSLRSERSDTESDQEIHENTVTPSKPESDAINSSVDEVKSPEKTATSTPEKNMLHAKTENNILVSNSGKSNGSTVSEERIETRHNESFGEDALSTIESKNTDIKYMSHIEQSKMFLQSEMSIQPVTRTEKMANGNNVKIFKDDIRDSPERQGDIRIRSYEDSYLETK